MLRKSSNVKKRKLEITSARVEKFARRFSGRLESDERENLKKEARNESRRKYCSKKEEDSNSIRSSRSEFFSNRNGVCFRVRVSSDFHFDTFELFRQTVFTTTTMQFFLSLLLLLKIVDGDNDWIFIPSLRENTIPYDRTTRHV